MNLLLEIILSIVALFIIFSVINSGVVEFIVQAINFRGQFLKNRIVRFFNAQEVNENLGEKIYNNILIKGLKKSRYNLPNEIDKKSFTSAFLQELFVKDGKIKIDQEEIEQSDLPQAAKEALLFIYNKYLEKGLPVLEGIQTEVEDLYERYMNSVSLWYKQRMQLCLFISGMCLALFFNIDTIGIVEDLRDNNELRRQSVVMANYVNENFENIEKNKTKVVEYLNSVDSIQESSMDSVYAMVFPPEFRSKLPKLSNYGIGYFKIFHTKNWMKSLFGALITGIALSLGASFWYEILKKAISWKK